MSLFHNLLDLHMLLLWYFLTKMISKNSHLTSEFNCSQSHGCYFYREIHTISWERSPVLILYRFDHLVPFQKESSQPNAVQTLIPRMLSWKRFNEKRDSSLVFSSLFSHPFKTQFSNQDELYQSNQTISPSLHNISIVQSI